MLAHGPCRECCARRALLGLTCEPPPVHWVWLGNWISAAIVVRPLSLLLR